MPLLLDYYAFVHVRDHEGRTPLHDAAYRNRRDVVRFLLTHNAEVNARDNNGLSRASSCSDTSRLQLLFDNDADEHGHDDM